MIDFMLDVLITFALGLSLGAFIVYGKGNRILGTIATIVLGGLFGYLLFQTLPLDMQSLWYILQLTGFSQELNLAYQVGGFQGLVSVARYTQYIAVAVGVVISLFGYGLALLTSEGLARNGSVENARFFLLRLI